MGPHLHTSTLESSTEKYVFKFKVQILDPCVVSWPGSREASLFEAAACDIVSIRLPISFRPPIKQQMTVISLDLKLCYQRVFMVTVILVLWSFILWPAIGASGFVGERRAANKSKWQVCDKSLVTWGTLTCDIYKRQHVRNSRKSATHSFLYTSR